jgi:hypothetical protein
MEKCSGRAWRAKGANRSLTPAGIAHFSVACPKKGQEKIGKTTCKSKAWLYE